LSDAPIAENPGPERPAAGPQDHPAAGPGARKRRRRIAVLRPIVLGAVGLALLLISFFLYPRTNEPPSPAFARLAVSTTFPVAFIDYTVFQPSPSVAEVKISVVLPVGTSGPPAGAPIPSLALALPFGTDFRDCHLPACEIRRKGITSVSVWIEPLNFRPEPGSGWTAVAAFFVKASNFGVTSDGVNASAAIPEILYGGGGQPKLLTLYHLRSASSYDWSGTQTALVTSATAQWQTDVVSADTPGQAAVGVDHAAQQHDDIKIFIAGALLGIAGGAIVAAVQEAMPSRDLPGHPHDLSGPREQGRSRAPGLSPAPGGSADASRTGRRCGSRAAPD
jgi:hypothetical protein